MSPKEKKEEPRRKKNWKRRYFRNHGFIIVKAYILSVRGFRRGAGRSKGMLKIKRNNEKLYKVKLHTNTKKKCSSR